MYDFYIFSKIILIKPGGFDLIKFYTRNFIDIEFVEFTN